MIPFGNFRPDAAAVNAPVTIEAVNVVPGAAGFLPLQTLVPGTAALPGVCRGAVSVLKDDGEVETFAATPNKLLQLSATAGWDDVSEPESVLDDFGATILDDAASVITIAGDDYNVGAGEYWKFALYGDLLIGTNVNDGPQKFNVTSSTSFAALGGSPPAARYIDVVREFVVLGAIFGNEKRVQWSANGNAEGWTVGTNESDYQDFPNGGPVRGIIGGEVGYVMQASKVTRMTYAPGTPLIFQFDEVEGAAGLAGPHSLVRLRSDAFYLAQDGFRRMSLAGGSSQPIGFGKWAKWFQADLKAGQTLTVLGVANPIKPIIVWAYVSRANVGTTPDRLLIYDWSLDEATYADVSVEALVQWLSPGVTLDTINGYGTLDTLPFSLDSPFWRGGAAIMGVFGTDHKLALQTGSPMQATITTTDGQTNGRVLITGVRPAIDTAAATVGVAVRERQGDAVSFGALEAMEDTGVCPAFASGNLVRARVVVPSGATWSGPLSGLETVIPGKMGKR